MKKLWIKFKLWQCHRLIKRISAGRFNLLKGLKLALLFLLVAAHGQGGVCDSQAHISLVVYEALQDLKEPRPPKLREIEAIVAAVNEALPRVPLAGLPDTVLPKFLAIIYGESGFHWNAKHKNHNGTWDIGLCQVNQIHWDRRLWKDHQKTSFQQWCQCEGLPQDESRLWNVRDNILFAAYIWQMELEQGKKSYRWAKLSRPDQVKFYRMMKARL